LITTFHFRVVNPEVETGRAACKRMLMLLREMNQYARLYMNY